MAEESEKRAKARRMVVQELINTEKDYIRDLKVMVKHYVKPLRENETITAQELVGLFSNIEQLIPVNEELMRQLGEAEDGCVGKPLLNMGPYMKMYSTYCNNQTEAMSLMAKLMEENEEFYEHCQAALGKRECRMLDLGSFLVKPMQRVCKYPLLLRELLKNTDESHPDHSMLTQAMDIIGQAVTSINEYKRNVELSSVLLEIQAEIEPATREEPVDIMAPARRYLEQSDVVYVTTKFKRVKAHYFLFNDLLVLTKAKAAGKYRFILQVPMNEALINDVNVAGEPFALEVIHAGRPKIWLCFQEEEKRDALRKQLLELIAQLLEVSMDEYVKEMGFTAALTSKLGIDRVGEGSLQGNGVPDSAVGGESSGGGDALTKFASKPLPRPPDQRSRRMTLGPLPSPSSKPKPPPSLHSPLTRRTAVHASPPSSPVPRSNSPLPSPSVSALASTDVVHSRRRRATVSGASPSRSASPTKPPLPAAAKPPVPKSPKPPVPSSPKPMRAGRTSSSPKPCRASPSGSPKLPSSPSSPLNPRRMKDVSSGSSSSTLSSPLKSSGVSPTSSPVLAKSSSSKLSSPSSALSCSSMSSSSAASTSPASKSSVSLSSSGSKSSSKSSSTSPSKSSSSKSSSSKSSSSKSSSKSSSSKSSSSKSSSSKSSSAKSSEASSKSSKTSSSSSSSKPAAKPSPSPSSSSSSSSPSLRPQEVAVHVVTAKKSFDIKLKRGSRYAMFRTRVCRASRQFTFRLEYEIDGERRVLDDDEGFKQFSELPDGELTLWLT